MSDNIEHNEDTSLTKRVAKGAAWLVSTRMAMKAIGVINTIVVARLLLPEDFGLVAIAVAAMQLIQGFFNIGLAQAVIKFRDASDDDYNTLFTFSTIRAFIIALFLLALGPVAAASFHDQRLVGVFAAIALHPLFLGLMNPRFFEFEKAMDFSKEFMVTVTDKFFSVSISIIIALIFRSYWALIIGMLTGGVVKLIFSYTLRPAMPKFTFRSWRRVLGFSGWLTGVSFVVALNNKLDSIILARFIGLPATGVFYLGNQLAGLITTELADPLARVIYPGLSERQGRAEEMRKAFLGGVEAVAAIALPAAFGLSFIASDLVPFVLGEKWIPAIPVIVYMAPAYGVQATMLSVHYYAIAQDRARLVFNREVAFLFLKLPLFTWAAATHGLVGAVIAAATCCTLYVIFELVLYAQVAKDRIWRPVWRARRSIAGVGAMAAWFVIVKPGFATIGLSALSDLPVMVRLGVDIVMGGVFYIGSHYILWRLEGMPVGVEAQISRLIEPVFVRLLGKRS